MTNKTIKKYSKQIHFYYHYLIQQKSVRLSSIHRNIILFGIPTHGNIGDEAIAYAEHEFLKNKYFSENIVEITEENTIPMLRSVKKQLKQGDIVCFHGGGNFGTLYPYQENIRETVVMQLSHIPVVSFPQSVFFEKEKSKLREELENFYHNHDNFFLILREAYSYRESQKFLPTGQLSLTPDIVFYLIKIIQGKINIPEQRKKVLCILRNDHEKKIDRYFTNSMKDLLVQNQKKVTYSDTISENNSIDTMELREKIVNTKINEIADNDMVITDRLHGMILSILAHRPCVVLQNGNPKIQSTVKTWLNSCPLVFYLEETNISNLEIALHKVENLDVSSVEEWFANLDLDKLYQPIERLINTN